MQQVDSKRIILVDTPEARLEVEYNEKFVVLHLPRVTKFGKKELLLFKSYIEGIYDFMKTIGVDILYAAFDDKKIEKLSKALGFEYLGQHEQYKVYRYASSNSNYRSSSGGSGDGSLSRCSTPRS